MILMATLFYQTLISFFKLKWIWNRIFHSRANYSNLFFKPFLTFLRINLQKTTLSYLSFFSIHLNSKNVIHLIAFRFTSLICLILEHLSIWKVFQFVQENDYCKDKKPKKKSPSKKKCQFLDISSSISTV